MKYLKKSIVILGIVFVGIQLIPTKHNQVKTDYTSDFMTIFKVPKNIESKIKTSCYDCHSNNTRYPRYNNIQPVAWFLEGHIKKGKKELNFSDFGNYSKHRQKNKLKAIKDQIKDGEMPLSSYMFMHRDAKLSEFQKNVLMNYMERLRDSLN